MTHKRGFSPSMDGNWVRFVKNVTSSSAARMGSFRNISHEPARYFTRGRVAPGRFVEFSRSTNINYDYCHFYLLVKGKLLFHLFCGAFRFESRMTTDANGWHESSLLHGGSIARSFAASLLASTTIRLIRPFPWPSVIQRATIWERPPGEKRAGLRPFTPDQRRERNARTSCCPDCRS